MKDVAGLQVYYQKELRGGYEGKEVAAVAQFEAFDRIAQVHHTPGLARTVVDED